MFVKSSAEGKKSTCGHTKRLKHDLLLDFSEESLFDGTDRTFSKVHVELPYPLHKSLKTSEDLVLQLLEEKASFNELLTLRKRKYRNHDKKRIKKEQIGGSQYIYLPQYLVDFYKEKDPDPCFDSDYNYYYTGGNLEYFKMFNNEYLIRPDLDNNLCINNMHSDEDIINDVIKLDYKTKNIIFNINSTKISDGVFLILREKNRISAVKCEDINKLTLKYTCGHKWTLLDAKLNKDMKLGMIFSNSRFSLKDIETNQSNFSFNNNLEGYVDCFQNFSFLDANTIVLMDRCKVKIIDMRTKMEQMCFEPDLLECNPFYNFTMIDNTLLLASRHYVIKTDLRHFKNCFYYSHSLSEAPCYMDHAFKDSDTYLCVSGQNYDGRVLFTGQAPYSVPFKIPSLKRTLIETSLMHPCIVLENHLLDKIKYSLTGLRVLNVGNNVSIYTSNCFGEIFRQDVHEDNPDNNKSIRKMYEWTKSVGKPEPTLHLTNFEELGDIRFTLNEPINELKLKKYKEPGNEEEFLKKFNSIYSTKNVKSKLAKDFLSIWEDSDEEEEEEIENLPHEETLDKVKSWIQTHDFEEDLD